MPDKPRACDQEEVTITQADLPLSCPLPRLRLWDAHPKVFLPIEDTKDRRKSCPYCGTTYVLTTEEASA